MVGKRKAYFGIYHIGKKNLNRHNFNVMHIVKNVFENFFYTVMDVKAKTKDNVEARRDLKLYYRKRKRVEDDQRAYYALDKNQKKSICE